jgi:hypothetical protein
MKNSNTWYQKMFAIIALVCSTFMFVAFSGSYAHTMDWIDVQLGNLESRTSEGRQWLQVALGQGIEVDAQLSVAVVEDIPQRIEQALVAAVSSILNSILGTVGQIFDQLLDKIQEMAGVFDSLIDQAANIKLAFQMTIWPKIEQGLSSLSIIDNILPDFVPDADVQALGDAAARLRIARVAQETQDLTQDGQTEVSGNDLQEAEQQVAEAATSACTGGSEIEGRLFDRIRGFYRTGCAAEVQEAVATAVAEDVETVEENYDNVVERAPADCQQPYTETGGALGATTGGISQIVSQAGQRAGRAIRSAVLEQVQGYADGTTIETLSPDDCEALQSSTDTALAGAQVTPPSNSGATGLTGVIQTFIDTIVGLFDKLINSIIDIALNALESVFTAFPRIFTESFNQIVGNFSSAISSTLSGLVAEFNSYEDSIKTPTIAQATTPPQDQKTKSHAL